MKLYLLRMRRRQHLAVGVCLFLFAALLGQQQALARPSPSTPTPTSQSSHDLMRPNEATSGTLLFQSIQDGLYVAAPLVATDVEIDVTGLVARAKVTQRFTNPTDSWVEGLYVFPLPDKSAVDSLRMQIGERFIEGQIKERKEAREIYEAAKTAGKKASLLEQQRPNLFTNAVANIGPGETVIVQIEYQQALSLEAGQVDLRLPLVVAPRYSPPAKIQLVSLGDSGFGQISDPVPDRAAIDAPVLDPGQLPEDEITNPVWLTVNVKSGFPIDTLASLNHEIVTTRTSASDITVNLAEGAVSANQDFVLQWQAKPADTPAAALFQERVDGEDYLYLLITPPSAEQNPITQPREVIFVIDTSGSMAGPSIRQARESLALALTRLSPEDRFNVIQFDDEMDVLFEGPVAATDSNLQRAAGYVRGLTADGGTEMLPALRAALFDTSRRDIDDIRQVIFLTDGAIGNEAQLFETIAEDLGRSRLFTVGIGSAPNSYFMSRAARIGRGTFTHISDVDQVADQMNTLFTKLEHPVAKDFSVSWSASQNLEMWPNPLPDLYAGEPIVISAKMPKAEGQITITGTIGNERWAAALSLSDAVPGKGIAQIWARQKIASLEESRYEGVASNKIDDAVLKVALDHHLISRLTSLVAIDTTPSRPENAPLTSTKVPLALPAGWDFGKVFGEFAPEPIPPIDMQDANAAPKLYAMVKTSDAAPSASTLNQPSKVMLPATATPAGLHMWIGFLLLIAAASLLVAARRFNIMRRRHALA